MTASLKFPTVKGGRVTDGIFSPSGYITELWIVLDSGIIEIEFLDECIIEYSAKIHLNSVAGAVSK
jgi:hypothetical protein